MQNKIVHITIIYIILVCVIARSRRNGNETVVEKYEGLLLQFCSLLNLVCSV
jgi:hypothetical protein